VFSGDKVDWERGRGGRKRDGMRGMSGISCVFCSEETTKGCGVVYYGSRGAVDLAILYLT
jgi:hypothetical protein